MHGDSHKTTEREPAIVAALIHPTRLDALDVDSGDVSSKIRTWEDVRIPDRLLRFRRWVVKLLWVFLIIVLIIPWTQTVTVMGKISAYDPYDRPQDIEARITGRLKKWHVFEGIRVKQGELLLELADFDPSFMAPDLLLRLQQQREALEATRVAALERADWLTVRIDQMVHLVQAAVPSAGARIEEAQNRVRTGEQRLLAARIEAETAQLNVDRHRVLAERGLVSQREMELALQMAIATQAELAGARAALRQAEQAAKAFQFDRAGIEADMMQRLQQAQAERAAALAQAARAMDELAGTMLRLSNAEERRAASRIYAPEDGTVVRMAQVGLGETVREGDVLVQLSPKSEDPALEVIVDNIDATLLAPMRRVRLLFHGTPAVQLASWPDNMAGTFWGVVKVVDQISSDDRGNFRLWITPDPEQRPWPPQEHVRQGTMVMGWVIADRVPLIVELLRRVRWLPGKDTPLVQMLDKVLPKAGRGAK